MERSVEESVLVVVEGDAACPLWLNHWGPAPVNGWSMLEQEEGETQAAFGERMTSTIERFSDPESNDVVVIVVGRGTGESACGSRWDLAGTVLTHLSKRAGGRVLFTHGYGCDDAPDASLAAFVAELAAEWSWSGIEIGVRTRGIVRTPQLRRTSAPPPGSYRPDALPASQAV